GADGVGVYSYTHSYITYFMLFGALGTAGYGAREIARARDDRSRSSKLFWEIELMTVFTSGICLIAWAAFILFNVKYRMYYIALTPFLLSTMFDISWYFTGYEKVKNIVIRNSAVRIIGIVLLFALVKEKDDLILYCVINSVTALLGNMSMWLYMPKMLEKIDFKTLEFKHHFHETLIYFIPTIAISIYTVLDKTLIGMITGNEYQSGYYEQATKIINLVKSVVFVAVNSVMGARISYLFAGEKYDEIKKRIARAMDFIYLLAWGAVFGIVGVAARFVPMFFGKGYDEVITLLYLMVPLVLIIGTSHCLGSLYYTPSGQRKRSAKIIVLGACINLCLNLILIPRFQSYGATTASIIAELTITVIYIQMSAGYMTWKQILKYSWKRAVAGMIMLVFIGYLGTLLSATGDVVAVATLIISGAACYGIVLLLLRDSMLRELINTGLKMMRKIYGKITGAN
ncbi:MAG: oligosaccharide flippase family protein, partial [Oscillospiraceae bacterium]|nr:oligosaccharide flippase family protein [Oscillospiraceae bacterium]